MMNRVIRPPKAAPMITARLDGKDVLAGVPLDELPTIVSPVTDEELLLVSDGDAGSCGRVAE